MEEMRNFSPGYVALFVLGHAFPFATARKRCNYCKFRRQQPSISVVASMSQHLAVMANVDPHPGTPVAPADLLTMPKWTDTPELKGKVAELRLELNSGGKKDKNNSAKKIALKKIVANMTMSNNDMVALFPDVVGCMQIPSLEIKKMYAASQTPIQPAYR